MVKAKPTAGKSLVKWDEEFAKFAKESTKGMTLPTAKFLSLRGGKLSFAGADVPGNELQAIILGWVHENQYYDEDFDPDQPQSPVCYAFGTDQDEMIPNDNVPDKQHDSCSDCPMNQWDSGPRGRGKACKNVIRLALIAESDLEDLSSAEIVYMKVPVMSTKNFAMYAKKTIAEALGRPYWSVVTNISAVPDPKSQFRVSFEFGGKIEDSELFGPLKDLWEKTMENINFPYPKIEPTEKPARGKKPVGKSKFARK